MVRTLVIIPFLRPYLSVNSYEFDLFPFDNSIHNKNYKYKLIIQLKWCS